MEWGEAGSGDLEPGQPGGRNAGQQAGCQRAGKRRAEQVIVLMEWNGAINAAIAMRRARMRKRCGNAGGLALAVEPGLPGPERPAQAPGDARCPAERKIGGSGVIYTLCGWNYH